MTRLRSCASARWSNIRRLSRRSTASLPAAWSARAILFSRERPPATPRCSPVRSWTLCAFFCDVPETSAAGVQRGDEGGRASFGNSALDSRDGHPAFSGCHGPMATRTMRVEIRSCLTPRVPLPWHLRPGDALHGQTMSRRNRASQLLFAGMPDRSDAQSTPPRRDRRPPYVSATQPTGTLQLDRAAIRPMYRELLAIDLPTVAQVARSRSIDIQRARASAGKPRTI